MKKVIVFRTDLLHRSETFIKEQVLALTQCPSVLTGYRKVEGGLDLTDMDVRILPGLSTGKWPRWWLRLCQWCRVPHGPTVRIFREAGASLIHVHFGTDAVDIWPSARKLGLPMLVTLHGYDINIYREWWEAGHGGMRRRGYPRQLLKLARDPNVRFVAVSKAIEARAIQFGIPADRITVCYIGVDTDRFQPGPVPIAARPNRVLFVGRLVEKKGLEYLLHAFVGTRNRIPDAELVVAGDGVLRGRLELLAHSLKIPVLFLGEVSSSQVQSEMRKARIFCLPSIVVKSGDAEGLPIVILEAQASGIPVVTSARGGYGEAVIDELTGFCFSEGNTELLTSILTRLLSNDDLACKMAANARAHIENVFSMRLCIKKLEETYQYMNRCIPQPLLDRRP